MEEAGSPSDEIKRLRAKMNALQSTTYAPPKAAARAVAIARELAGFLWAALQPVATPAM
jgi:hypothetical protein